MNGATKTTGMDLKVCDECGARQYPMSRDESHFTTCSKFEVKTTCYRLVGKEGEQCQTCGRLIVRHELTRTGSHYLSHEGPTIAQKLAALNEQRRLAKEAAR